MFDHLSRIRATAHGLSVQDQAVYSAATDYLARGWSVIPLLGKRPGLDTWKEFQHRLPTRQELLAWFSVAHPAPTGVGVVTGKLSGLVVVDCDTSEDARYWLGRYPESPFVVETGRGGVHVYYSALSDSDVHNRVKLHGRQIDVRGEGGYVVAPPSQHPNGNLYAWRAQCVDLREPLPCFDSSWLIDPGRPTTTPPVSLPVGAVRNAAAYIRRIHATAGQGGHNATYRAACKLRDAGLSPEEALALLVEWNETNAHPPWDEDDLIHKIKSAFNALTR